MPYTISEHRSLVPVGAATAEAIGDAATALEEAAALLRQEAAWIAGNFPLHTWTDAETARSYVRSSLSSRIREVRAAASAAVYVLETAGGQ